LINLRLHLRTKEKAALTDQDPAGN